jgi:hypothetical protein
MLKCREIAHRASEYIDREVPWQKRLAMAFHLLMCGHCRRFVDQMRLAIKATRERKPTALGAKQAAAISKRAMLSSTNRDN